MSAAAGDGRGAVAGGQAPYNSEDWYWFDEHGCVACPECAFTFSADHVDQETNRYSCPCCEERRLRALLTDIADSGVAFEDPRISYVEVQVDAETWATLQRDHASTPAPAASGGES